MAGLFEHVPEGIVKADKALFKAINSGLYHPVMEEIMKFTANDLFLIAVLFAGFLLIVRPASEESKAYTAFSLWALVAANFLNSRVLKPLFGRLRPSAEIENMHMLVTMKKLGWAFPSTHTAMAAALVAVLWPSVPKARPYLAAFLVLIAFFCVYTGGHYPLDTIAGAITGFLTGFVFLKLKDAYFKTRRMN